MQSLIQTYLPLLEKKIADYPVPDKPASLYDPIRYFLQLPGKRIRPIFTLLSLELFRPAVEEDYQTALSTELFHNFSLVHDDIMDKADLRRGFLTLHTKWDEPTALLAGDALLVLAYQALVSGKPDNLKLRIDRFNQMSLAVCEGQQLDMDFSRMETISTAQYFDMIDCKTGALIAFSFELGGLLGQADENECSALHQFGQAMGRCFQLRDDFLDLFGEEQLTGKKRGGDIGNCKLTYPVLLSLPEKEFLEIWESKPAADDTRIQRALEWMESNGIPEKVEKMITQEMAMGLDLLQKVKGDSQAKNHLQFLCESLANRVK